MKEFFLILFLFSFSFPSLMVNTSSIEVISQDQNPMLFLHGWLGSSSNWDRMIERFQAGGQETNLYSRDFDDPGNCSRQANINNAHQIKQWVDDILTETGSEKVDLVCHSMGGISSRYYIRYLGGMDSVDNHVSFGSPHHGDMSLITATCWLPLNGLDTLLLMLNEGDETPGGIMNDTLGDRLDPYHEITYNGTHVPGNISYTSIYSTDDGLISPYNSSLLEGALNVEVSGLTHNQLILAPLGYELAKMAVEDTISDFNYSDYQTATTSTLSSQTTYNTAAPSFQIAVSLISLASLIVLTEKRRMKQE